MKACSDERTAQISDFAIGRLPDEQMDELLAHLETCEDCAAYLELIVGILRCQEEYGETLYKERRSLMARLLGRVCGEKQSNSPLVYIKRMVDRFMTLRPLWKTVTASVPIAVVGILLFGVVLPSYYLGREIMALADPQPDSYKAMQLRSGRKDHQILFDEGMDYYLEERWDDAIEQLRMAVELKPDYSMALYYLGISCLMERRADESIEYLDRTASITRSSELREKSHWYMAHGYLMKKDAERALDELDLVLEEKGSHRALAEGLQQRILDVLER